MIDHTEDAAAKERSMTVEEVAKNVLAWVRTDTGLSNALPGDERRESLLTRSLLSRVEDALRAHAEQARAEGKAEGAAEEREAWVEMLSKAIRAGGEDDG